MPDLFHTLIEYDIGLTQIIAESWGIELVSVNPTQAVNQIVSTMIDAEFIDEIIETLPRDAMDVLRKLLKNSGLLPWSHFERDYGEVRVMGPAKRDRERPDINPATPTEILWYKGLVGKAFLDIPPVAQDYAYIPDDLLEYLQFAQSEPERILGRPASPGESAFVLPASDQVLNHTCTLLAGLRMGMQLDEFERFNWDIPPRFIYALMEAYEMFDFDNDPVPQAIKEFLERPRSHSLVKLFSTWLSAERLNDLKMLPGLKFEGTWENKPHKTRQTVMALLSEPPQNSWWSISAFIQSIKTYEPDFQRPNGDYDSWFIARESDGSYVRGFAAWDEVEGALLRYLITGPLHWLGYFDLAASEAGGVPQSFRPSSWAVELWNHKAPKMTEVIKEPVHIKSEGKLLISRNTPLTVRYLIARFCDWEKESNDTYHYKITPFSLERAKEQRLTPSHLLKLLHEHASAPPPPALRKSLENWQRFGKQTSLEEQVLLRVQTPSILVQLKKSPAGRFIVEELNATTAIIRKAALEKVRAELAALGYLSEADPDPPEKP